MNEKPTFCDINLCRFFVVFWNLMQFNIVHKSGLLELKLIFKVNNLDNRKKCKYTRIQVYTSNLNVKIILKKFEE